MNKDFTKVIMNPIRQRVIQLLIRRGTATTSQMLEELQDIPQASLYRHLRILLEAECITVVEENKIRGTIEKTYGLAKEAYGGYQKDEVSGLIQSTLLSLMGSFKHYFEDEEADPIKDILSLSTSTLLLSDDELREILDEIGQIIKRGVDNKPSKDRKERRFTFILSPCEEE